MQSVTINELSILLIEPSPTQLKVIVQQLQKAGVGNIETLGSGQQLLERLSEHKPDLVISSMYLPDMTAAELIHGIRHDEGWHDVPFMLISSESAFQALESIRQAGVVAILPKPFAFEDLKRALRATIEYIDPQEINLDHYDIEHLRVLLVDDSALARKHVAKILNNMGISQITFAVDGIDGLQKYQDNPDAIDLIITDYNMPNMDGQQMIRAIRQELGNTVVPILMVTSEDNETRLSNVHQAGVSGICDKPFDPHSVKEMLYRIFS
jgi:two-component system, chemotaxis family, chemotaxis protein CheY